MVYLDLMKKGKSLPLDFATFEGFGVQVYEVAKAMLRKSLLIVISPTKAINKFRLFLSW